MGSRLYQHNVLLPKQPSNRLLGFILFSVFLLIALNVQAKDDDTIIIATHIDPPSVYLQDGLFKGHNVDVANLLINRIDKNFAFVYCPFARCLTMLRDGKADMMIAINKTKERLNYFDYLEQPFHSLITPVRFYKSMRSDINIESYDDLKGVNIGVLRGASYFEKFDNDASLKKVYISTHRQLIDMLVKGRIDVFLGREISIKHQVSQQIYSEELITMPYVYSKNNDFYIAVSKKSLFNDEVKKLSGVLNQLLADGSIEALNNPYSVTK